MVLGSFTVVAAFTAANTFTEAFRGGGFYQGSHGERFHDHNRFHDHDHFRGPVIVGGLALGLGLGALGGGNRRPPHITDRHRSAWRRSVERQLVQIEVDVTGSQFTQQTDQIGQRSSQPADAPCRRDVEVSLGNRVQQTELVAYLSLPCWYKDDRSGDRDRSLTIPPRREPRNGISYLDQ